MELLKGVFWVLLGNLVFPAMMIYACRINAMTFKSFSRTYTIRNIKLTKILIAKKTTWEVSTSRDKRNKMSVLGLVSYILFLPQICFYIYNLWIFITIGDTKWCELEKAYNAIMCYYYLITLTIKNSESGKYQKGEIW